MKRIALIATSALLILTACSKKEEPAPVPQKPAEPTATVSPFTPNSSGQVTLLQAKFWNAANPGIDSLCSTYADQISAKDTAASQAALSNFNAAKESHCKASGLSGGVEEYEWISKNIFNPVNKPVLDSINYQTL